MDLTISIILFIIATAFIVVAGTMLTRTADQLADATGLGEALLGAIFLGGVTSISGIIASVVAAYDGHAELSVSNAIGGIAAQTVFLSIADIAYHRTNLEHASVSLANIMQGIMLTALLALVIIGISMPEYTILNIHPLSIIILVVYVAGQKLIAKAKDEPMWTPRATSSTVKDIPEKKNMRLSLGSLILKFIVLALIVAAAGYAVAKSGINIANNTGLSESFVGVLFTAVATSLTELIVSIAAVRQGALTLAVGNIIGGNTFDVLFVAFSDVAYTEGSILHAITNDQIFIISLTMVMVSILILGLLYRERRGFLRIGWESTLIILLYLIGNSFLFFLF
jgi:cation:H+ antiporter